MNDVPPGPPPMMEGPPVGGPPPMAEGGSFAQSMGSFGAMLKIQENISQLLPASKVPWSETRKFLKANTIEVIKATSLYKFHMRLFKKIGLGDMQLVAFAPMHYIFAVPNCPVCGLYPALNNQKVCVATTDALHRFFTEDLELACTVEETECVKDGAQMCKFKVDLQPISAYQIMLDAYDKMILAGKRPPKIDDAEVRSRVQLLTIYKLLDNGKLSEMGGAYMQYAGSVNVEEQIFDPPWKMAEELEKVAEKGGTFGAAFSSMKQSQQPADATPQPQEPKDVEMSAKVKSEAKKTDSFAELLAKMKKDQ